jgi:hypothetical protein
MNNFLIYFQSILQKIKSGEINNEIIENDALLQFNFFIKNIFNETESFILSHHKRMTPDEYDESSACLSESAKNCDHFKTYFRNACCKDLSNQLAHLLLLYISSNSTNLYKVNYKWIVQEILAADETLETAFKTLRNKLKKSDNSYTRTFVLKMGSFEAVAASLKSSERNKEQNSEHESVFLDLVSFKLQ